MTYNNALRKSTLREELKWKYIEKKIRLFVLVGLVLMTAWIANMMWATGQLASNLVYYLN